MKRKQVVGVLLLFAPLAFGTAQAEEHLDRKQVAEVQTYLVPLSTDMKSAEVVSAGLQEMAVVDDISSEEVRKSAYLADQTINIAHARAQQLKQTSGLSDEERRKVQKTVTKLSDARESVNRLQTSIAASPGELRRQDTQRLRQEAEKLHSHILDAQLALNGLAEDYGVDTRRASLSSSQ